MIYSEFVKALCKPGEVIASEMTLIDSELSAVAMDIFCTSGVVLKFVSNFSNVLPLEAHLKHMAIGIAGEAGELLDAIKKAIIYRKPLDLENVKEEVGDIYFYVVGFSSDYPMFELEQIVELLGEMCQLCGFTLNDCVEANKAKLSKRYESLSYSDKAAEIRADKQ